MFRGSKKSMTKNILKACARTGKKRLSNKLFILLASTVGLFSAEAALLSKAAPASISSNEPVVLAQQINGRVAHLVCGEYDIMLRFVGTAASDQYSYQTHGLYLADGYREGETYHFFNNDFEYRVVTHSGGSGSLTVLHYGETLLTKSCTWD